MPDEAKCQSCGADILWVIMKESGAKMPLDAQSTANGKIRVSEDGTAKVMTMIELIAWQGSRHTSHFATCPNAAQHRKKVN